MSLQLSEIFTCHICSSYFESPVVLPCAEVVCEKHLVPEFECKNCNETHICPENGFPSDDRIASLINLNIHLYKIGEKHKLAKEYCDNLEKSIGDYEALLNDPSFFSYEYLAELKNKIDLKESLGEIGTEEYENILKEIEDFENKCKTKFDSDEKRSDTITNIKSNLVKFKEQVETPNESDFFWKKLGSDIWIDEIKMKDLTDDLKQSILDHKNIKLVEVIGHMNERINYVTVEEVTKILFFNLYFSNNHFLFDS